MAWEASRSRGGDQQVGGAFDVLCQCLLAGENGQDWVAAAAAVAGGTGVPLTAGTVGTLGCDYIDMRRAWTRCRETSPDGAVPMRPDRYVAFRSVTGAGDPVATPRRALSAVLSTARA